MKGGFYFAPIKNMSASKQKKTTHKKRRKSYIWYTHDTLNFRSRSLLYLDHIRELRTHKKMTQSLNDQRILTDTSPKKIHKRSLNTQKRREIQAKSTMTCHFKLTSRVMIKMDNNKWCWGYGKLEHPALLLAMWSNPTTLEKFVKQSSQRTQRIISLTYIPKLMST